MVDRDYILAPSVVEIGFALDAVLNQAHSLELLNAVEQLSGLSSWVTETAQSLPDDLRRQNLLFAETGWFIMSGVVLPPLADENLPQYIDRVVQRDAQALMAEVQATWIRRLEENPQYYPDLDVSNLHALFTSRDEFVRQLGVLSCKPEAADVWNEAFDLMQQPAAYLARLRQHIHTMWECCLGEEWMRQLPLLNESMQAFQRMDLRDLTIYDAIRIVAGRDMRGKMEEYETHISQVVFIPSPHLGPYIARLPTGNTLRVLYGARLPQGMQAQASPLSRSELLIRMNALADDTRLRILEMLTQREELCAQDIIEALNVSQSTVSRHLSQLSATGFLLERRRDVNKCYSLNVDRVVDTVRALTSFLARQ